MSLDTQFLVVTGGLGYIGSHVVAALLESRDWDDHTIVIADNESTTAAPHSVKNALLGWNADAHRRLVFCNADVRDTTAMHELFFSQCTAAPTCVIHCAGLKAAGESIEQPLMYYDNNVHGSIVVLDAMSKRGCRNLIFSSSATVYGAPRYLPIDEKHPIAPLNPYGHSKAMVEQIVCDWQACASEGRSALLLRYMNPVGAHYSARLGETPLGMPNNLMPYVAEVAIGKRTHVNVFGDDYATRDGSGVRDYVHVEDLAAAHVEAATMLRRSNFNRCTAINIGRGVGISVLEMIDAFERASGKQVPYKRCARRTGDAAEVFCDNTLAKRLLPHTHEQMKGVDEMCSSAWHFLQQNIIANGKDENK